MSEGRFLREGEETVVACGWASAHNVLHPRALYALPCWRITLSMFSDQSLDLHARITICSHIRWGTGCAWFAGAMNCLSRA